MATLLAILITLVTVGALLWPNRDREPVTLQDTWW